MTDEVRKTFTKLVKQALQDDENMEDLGEYDASVALAHLFVCHRCPARQECFNKGLLNCEQVFSKVLLESSKENNT